MKYFSKKYRHLKSKIHHKFHRLLFFLFSILVIFFFLFHLSKLVKKFYTFLWFFIMWIIDFIRELWKFLEYLLKKQRYFKYKTFSEFHCLQFAFFIFQYFGHLFFRYAYLWFSKKFQNFCVVLMYQSQNLSNNFGKLRFFFKKKLRYQKSKISTKFHRFLFLFYFLKFLAFCFLFHVSKLIQKV